MWDLLLPIWVPAQMCEFALYDKQIFSLQSEAWFLRVLQIVCCPKTGSPILATGYLKKWGVLPLVVYGGSVFFQHGNLFTLVWAPVFLMCVVFWGHLGTQPPAPWWVWPFSGFIFLPKTWPQRILQIEPNGASASPNWCILIFRISFWCHAMLNLGLTQMFVNLFYDIWNYSQP